MVKKTSKKNDKKVTHRSLLLPREMFLTERAQLLVSLLMLIILIIQVYLFVSIHQMIREVTALI